MKQINLDKKEKNFLSNRLLSFVWIERLIIFFHSDCSLRFFDDLCIEQYRYPELLKPPDTSESLYSDRNSSYDNVEKRNEREEAGDSRKDQIYDSSEWETPLETDESDVERMKRNKSFKERLDPLLCKFFSILHREKYGTQSCSSFVLSPRSTLSGQILNLDTII